MTVVMLLFETSCMHGGFVTRNIIRGSMCHVLRNWAWVVLRGYLLSLKDNTMINPFFKKVTLFGSILLVTGFVTPVFAQTSFQSDRMDIRLQGTSNIHDWEMKAVAGSSSASFVIDAKNKVTALNSLTFTLPAKSLKSDSKAMDNNTYKALKSSANPNLSFVMGSATVVSTGNNSYQLNCSGMMSIAGTTKETSLVAIATYDPSDKTLTIKGVKKMKMTDYNVKPPKALLGTIKTGDQISISYTMKYSR